VEQGVQKLILGRIDIYIEHELVVAKALSKFDKGNFDPSSVHQVGIMWTGDSHVYLHKKNALLLPEIAEVLKSMKQEGLVERYRKMAQHAH
jgi:polar amino acid transport system substrate-binding protein